MAGLLLVAMAGPGPALAGCGFTAPELVELDGYHGTAMEPFVTRDGRYLLFNDSNDPANDTDLHYAQRRADAFEYRGEIRGANSADLDGVPSTDEHGSIYFVSPRSYVPTFSTIHRGAFVEGDVTGVEIVTGVSRGLPGFVNFDAEISSDGATLVYVDGFLVPGGPVPLHADLVLARRVEGGFERLDDSDRILAAVNTAALEYAPALSTDERELFFTRWLIVPGTTPRIYRSTRDKTSSPFGEPRAVEALTGFVEAPALSPDGESLYLHRKDGAGFRIYGTHRCSVVG